MFGLLREAVFAALFATTAIADAFWFAFRIPNLLREFFAEGALSAAFVPTLTEVRAREGAERARELAQRVFGTLLVTTGVLVVLGMLFAPWIVFGIAPDAPEALRPLTARLVRIMFPFLLLAALAAAVMGVLNSHRKYFIPALAPMFFNVIAVLGGVVLLLVGATPIEAVTCWAVLVVVGGILQVGVQLPTLKRLGYLGRPRLDLRLADPALRQIVQRMGRSSCPWRRRT